MKMFLGTKLIKAIPMTRLAYNQYRGWTLPADENGEDAGYLVEYLDGGQSNHPDHDGCISWSPEGVFEKAYQDVSKGCSFGHAVELMRLGYKVARSGWNGKGMFLLLITRDQWDFETDVSGVDGILTDSFICMKTAGNTLIPWLCSQADALSDDWVVIE